MENINNLPILPHKKKDRIKDTEYFNTSKIPLIIFWDGKDKWYRCKDKSCIKYDNEGNIKYYQTKNIDHFKRHNINKHTDPNEIKWFCCNLLINNVKCDAKFKNKDALKVHQDSGIHNNILRFECIFCDNKYNKKIHLYEHYFYKHYKNNKNLVQVNKIKHLIEDKILYCPIDDCSHIDFCNSHIERHLIQHHKINAVYKKCPEENCDFQYLDNTTFKSHLAFTHNIGAYIHNCDIEGCNYSCIGLSENNTGRLLEHKQKFHDIGDNECNFCLEKHYSSFKYNDEQGGHKICKYCYRKIVGYNSRHEKEWSDYLDKKFGIEYLLGSDNTLKSLGGCQLYRPDKIYTDINLIMIFECDEHQHMYNNGNYTCEEKRISDIYNEFSGKKMVVIRWNPDNYVVPKDKTKKNKQERLDLMVKLVKHLRQNPQEDMIKIYYMFYNDDNPQICKNYPIQMIYDKNDF
jgi:hypothetical protein